MLLLRSALFFSFEAKRVGYEEGFKVVYFTTLRCSVAVPWSVVMVMK